MNAPAREQHRWGERIALRTEVQLDVAGCNLGRGQLRDVSISGAFIETGIELPVFTNLVVRIPGGDSAAGEQSLAACVVRREAAGFAVEWRDMACEPITVMLKKRRTDCVSASS